MWGPKVRMLSASTPYTASSWWRPGGSVLSRKRRSAAAPRRIRAMAAASQSRSLRVLSANEDVSNQNPVILLRCRPDGQALAIRRPIHSDLDLILPRRRVPRDAKTVPVDNLFACLPLVGREGAIHRWRIVLPIDFTIRAEQEDEDGVGSPRRRQCLPAERDRD